MTRRIAVAVFAFTLAAGCGAVSDDRQRTGDALASNLLANPGFESDFQSWKQSEPAAISTSNVHGGKKSGKAEGAAGAIAQTVEGLSVGASYQAGFWALGNGTITVTGGAHGVVTQTVSAKTWTRIALAFVAKSEATLHAAAVGKGDLRVDDAFFAVVASAPDAGTAPVLDAGTAPVLDAGTPPVLDAGTPSASYPGQVLALSNWYLTLPTDKVKSGSPDNVYPPALLTLSVDPFFELATDAAGVTAVRFEANAGGAHTSNSSYPRSELREMQNGELASWSNTSGTHTMTLREAFTHLPVAKPQVVGAQIHDAEDDVIEVQLLGSQLWVEAEDGKNVGTLDANYVLGTPYDLKIEASGGHIFVWYNGVQKVDYVRSGSGWYFKAGCYTQSNPAHGDAASAYGETLIYSLEVQHQ